MHEHHRMYSPSIGLVPKFPQKWDTFSIGPSIDVVIDANESLEYCQPDTPHLWKGRLEVGVESVFQE